MSGPFDPISEGVGRGMQLYLEGKRRKKEESRYEKEQKALKELRDLQKRQAEQSMTLTQEQAEREKLYTAPGGVEKTNLPLARGLGGFTQEKIIPEGLGHQRDRLQTELTQKQIGGYESPGEQRTSEQDWERRMANLRHQHALELAGFKQGEVEEAPFDESGAFNIKHFFDTAAERYPDFSFFQMVDEGEIAKARDEIRNIVVGRFGTDPAKIQAIETALDMWIEGLFEMSKSMPIEEKNRSFGEVISKFGAWLTTPIGEEQRLTKREISKIPKMEEGPPIGVEFPVQTESTQVTLPTIEDKERKIQGLFTKDRGIFKKRKDQTRGLNKIMMVH